MKILPGAALAAVIALLAIALGNIGWLQGHGISALTMAIVLGIVVGNSVYPRIAHTSHGVQFSKQTLLRLGIVLYGIRLTFQDIQHVGIAGVVIDTVVVCTTFALAWFLGTRWLGLDRKTAMLIGAGSSICGAAAVMAAEPVVRGRAEQVTVAVSTVVVFGTIAIFLYPVLYHLNVFGISSPAAYGLFAGSTIHEVAQVVAAGRAISEQAAATAVITKMVRVMLLAPFLLGLSVYLSRESRSGSCALAPATNSGAAPVGSGAAAAVGPSGMAAAGSGGAAAVGSGSAAAVDSDVAAAVWKSGMAAVGSGVAAAVGSGNTAGVDSHVAGSVVTAAVGPGGVRSGGAAAVGPGGVAAVRPGGAAAVGPGGVAAVRPGGVATVRPGGAAAVGPGGVAAVRPGGAAAVGPAGAAAVGSDVAAAVGSGGVAAVGSGAAANVGPDGVAHAGVAGRITIPWFALGFVAVTALNSLVALPVQFTAIVTTFDTFVLAMAMAALGLTTHVSAIRNAGVRPLVLAALLFAWLIAGGVAINAGVTALLS